MNDRRLALRLASDAPSVNTAAPLWSGLAASGGTGVEMLEVRYARRTAREWDLVENASLLFTPLESVDDYYVHVCLVSVIGLFEE